MLTGNGLVMMVIRFYGGTRARTESYLDIECVNGSGVYGYNNTSAKRAPFNRDVCEAFATYILRAHAFANARLNGDVGGVARCLAQSHATELNHITDFSFWVVATNIAHQVRTILCISLPSFMRSAIPFTWGFSFGQHVGSHKNATAIDDDVSGDNMRLQ